eukprot:Ihof_evm14s62 gene=Ihof_evmTU14s62
MTETPFTRVVTMVTPRATINEEFPTGYEGMSLSTQPDTEGFNCKSTIFTTTLIVYYGIVVVQVCISIADSTLLGLDKVKLSKCYSTQMALMLVFMIMACIEFVSKIWSCTTVPVHRHPIKGRLSYMTTPIMIIDLITIAIASVTIATRDYNGIGGLATVMRTLRLLQLAKLFSYNKSTDIIGAVVSLCKENYTTIVSAWFLSAVCVLLFGSIIYDIEGGKDSEFFQTIPDGIYWAIVTSSTIGYGDKYPTVAWGKALACVMAWFVIPFFTLPTGIISTAFALKMDNFHAASDRAARLRVSASNYVQAWWRFKAVRCRSPATLNLMAQRFAFHNINTKAVRNKEPQMMSGNLHPPVDQFQDQKRKSLLFVRFGDHEIYMMLLILKIVGDLAGQQFYERRSMIMPCTEDIFSELRSVKATLEHMKQQVESRDARFPTIRSCLKVSESSGDQFAPFPAR